MCQQLNKCKKKGSTRQKSRPIHFVQRYSETQYNHLIIWNAFLAARTNSDITLCTSKDATIRLTAKNKREKHHDSSSQSISEAGDGGGRSFVPDPNLPV
jgi:hypothetical protein